MRRAAMAVVCLIGFVTGSLPCLAAGADPGRGLNFYSIEREIALGKQLAAELERQVKLVDDPILSDYVNRVAQNIARQSDIAIPVTVRIVESGDLNAFTLPGGHVYITSAMLRLTESEAEMAFVLAHELGHVAARHATREATRGQLLELGTVPLSVLGGWSGFAIRGLAGPSAKLGFLKGSREFESQADRLGIDYLDRSGYDPTAAVDVFERIEATERKRPGALARLYEDHPVTASRIEHTQKHLNEISGRRDAYVINTSDYEEMRLRMAAVEQRRTGQLEEGNQNGPTLARLAKTEATAPQKPPAED
jgi:predicted Zn-dependent protease